MQVLYTSQSRNRGNSDNLFSNTSTLLSALSRSSQMQEEGAAGNFEEYKSEDEMHRVLSDSEESKKSDREDAPRGRGGNIDS